MKKVYLLLLAVIVCLQLKAQQKKKLSDIVKQHEFEAKKSTATSNSKESKDAHFQRWLWYAQQHLDDNGYLVSEMEKLKEWKSYENQRALRKTTAASIADWKPIGANELDQSWYGEGFGLGRINVVSFHPTDQNTYFIGATNGGVWKTTDNGKTWSSLTDHLPVLTVSDIDVNPSNPNTIYLCTGDRDGADATWNHYSIGLQKSVDGGTTWSSVGPSYTISNKEMTNCLLINPSDTNSLTLAKQDGIYKSNDGGQNWINTLSNADVKQILYHPTDTTVIYAATTEDATSYAQFYRSDDGGYTWTQVTSFTDAGRIAMAVTKAAPDRVVILVAGAYGPSNYGGLVGLWTSNNKGSGFSQTYIPTSCSDGNILSGDANGKSCGGQAFYDIAIDIDPGNADNVFVGGVNGWYSTDAGVSWNNMNQWSDNLPGVSVVHADKHWLQFHPLVNGRLFECNDGGIAYSDNPANSNGLWVDITNGLEITQFYRIAVRNAHDTDLLIIGGAQDNSVFVIESDDINFIGTGDGVNAQVDEVNGVIYGLQQQGNILRYDPNNGLADVSAKTSGPWVTSMQLNPHNTKHLVAGYDEVMYSQDQGDNWMSVSGGPLTGAGQWINRVEMTLASDSTIYATMQGSNEVYNTHSFKPGSSATFAKLTPPYNGSISDIEVDPKDKDHFWITFSGYGSPQVAEYKGGNWTQMNTGLPDVPVLCIRQDTSNQTLYVGTDFGVFFREDSMTRWEAFDKNLPKVNVSDIEINYVSDKIYAGTYGRGIWQSPRQKDTTTTISVAVIPYADDVFTIAPNPNNGDFTLIAGASVTAGDAVSVSIIDYTGKTIMKNSTTVNGNRSIKVNAGNVPAGLYIVELSNDNAVIGRKRVIIR